MVKRQLISSQHPDWNREKITSFWMPSKQLLKSIRDYQKYQNSSGYISSLRKKIAVVKYRLWSTISGADIPLNCQIGGGLSMPHPNGIVIHPKVIIGVNCLIHQQVTLGVKEGENKPPVLMGHVDIGAGAKVIGNIVIGEHALIGANAVVTKNVMPHEIVAGIPAKVIGYTADTFKSSVEER